MTKILRMEFQPIFMSGHALRNKDQSFWENKMRPSVVPRKNPTCSVCGFVAKENRGLIHADEVWQFPGPPHVVLVEIRPLCVYCHDAKDYAGLLRRIQEGTSGAQRAAVVQKHYCSVNACCGEEFGTDYRAALKEKEILEELYGRNCAVNVDYGKWVPPERLPRLTSKQKFVVEALYKGETPIEYDKEGELICGGNWIRAEPIIIGDRMLTTYGTAIRYLQSLLPEERDSVINEMQEYVDSENDPEFEWTMDYN